MDFEFLGGHLAPIPSNLDKTLKLMGHVTACRSCSTLPSLMLQDLDKNPDQAC